jgi:hypothetical protein
MADSATAPPERVIAFRELCDIALSQQPQQGVTSAANPIPEVASCSDMRRAANTPSWVIFSTAICRDDVSVDAAWALM